LVPDEGPVPGAEVCPSRIAPHYDRLHPPQRRGNARPAARAGVL